MSDDSTGPDAREQAIEQAAKAMHATVCCPCDPQGCQVSEIAELSYAEALADAGLLRGGGDTGDDAAEWRRKILDVMGYDDTPEYAQELLYYLPAWKHEHDAVDERVDALTAERDQLRQQVEAVRALADEWEARNPAKWHKHGVARGIEAARECHAEELREIVGGDR